MRFESVGGNEVPHFSEEPTFFARTGRSVIFQSSFVGLTYVCWNACNWLQEGNRNHINIPFHCRTEAGWNNKVIFNFWPFLYGFGLLSMRSRLHPFSLRIAWLVSFCISIFGPFLYPLNSPVNLRLVSPFPPSGPREVFHLIRACAKSAAYGSARYGKIRFLVNPRERNDGLVRWE